MSATLTPQPTVPHDSPRTARRRPAGITEQRLYAAGICALALHLLDTALRGPATSLTGVVALVALAGVAIAVQPRLARRTRVAFSGVLGLMTVGMVGVSDGVRFLTSGPGWGQATGVVAAFGGLALVAAAAIGLRGPREAPRPRRALRGAGWASGALVVGAFSSSRSRSR